MASVRRSRFTSTATINHLILAYLLLLSHPTILFLAEGRHLHVLTRTAIGTKARVSVHTKTATMRKGMKMRMLIGSRPPRCEKYKCVDCGGHCEAVQVPITPSTRKEQQQRQQLGYYSRQEVLDYKPMSWKCRCGNFYLNPW